MKRCFLMLAPFFSALICGCGAQSSVEKPEPETTAPVVSTENTAKETQTETTESVTTKFQGGAGDERNADTPLPEYFVYRFHPDNVSVRLAGGTYQVLSGDFSTIFAKERMEIGYYLEDQNGDGSFDLFAPVAYDDDTVTRYAIFLWKPEEAKFDTEPLFYEPEA